MLTEWGPVPSTGDARAAGSETVFLQWRNPDDPTFFALLAAYRRHGGLARGAEVADRMLSLHCIDLSSLARRIALRQLLCFQWQGELWLPLVQFDPVDMSLYPGIAEASAQLAPAMTAWQVCQWFATPIAALGDRIPLALVPHESEALIRVAHEHHIHCSD